MAVLRASHWYVDLSTLGGSLRLGLDIGSQSASGLVWLSLAFYTMPAGDCDEPLVNLALDLVDAGILSIPKASRCLAGGDVLILT